MNLLIETFLNIILFINNLVGNLGLALIIFTIVFRLFTLAFTYKSLKSMGKMREISSQVKQLQKQYKNDPKGLQLAQLELYKKYNINPLSGCLPQLLQIAMLIVIYQVLIRLFKLDGLANTSFLWLDLTKPDPLYIIPILAAISQLFLSIMTLPGGEKRDLVPNDSSKKSIQELNKKEEDSANMAATMQKQMLIMMPIMTGFIALKLGSGLGLYWVVSTLFSIGQQYFISGWGGIVIYKNRLLKILSTHK